VGKTTLTYNIAAALAEKGKRVLLVDSDPQCNLTAYLIDNVVLDDLLDSSDSDTGGTLWSGVKPLIDASGRPKSIEAIEQFAKLWLLPGDIRLSDFEEELTGYWNECFQRKTRGFVGTMALSEIVNHACAKYKIHFVFYDSGPNIGPLNRIILLDCDYFIVPAAYDLFSIRALKTLGRTLFAWTTSWKTVLDLAPKETYLLPGRPKFMGYIPQNFKVYRGSVASTPGKYAGQLDRGIATDIVNYLKPIGLVASTGVHKLAEVKDFASLVTASQQEGKPLWSVSAGTPVQRASAHSVFRSIADKILSRSS